MKINAKAITPIFIVVKAVAGNAVYSTFLTKDLEKIGHVKFNTAAEWECFSIHGAQFVMFTQGSPDHEAHGPYCLRPFSQPNCPEPSLHFTNHVFWQQFGPVDINDGVSAHYNLSTPGVAAAGNYMWYPSGCPAGDMTAPPASGDSGSSY